MSIATIWNRVGAWLKRCEKHDSSAQAVQLDGQRSLVQPENSKPTAEPAGALVTHSDKTEQKLQTIEDGFNRLVDGLGDINKTMIQQQDQHLVIQKSLQELPRMVESLPRALEAQGGIVEQLTDQLRDQSARNQEVIAAIGTLPEQARFQGDKLGQISHHLQTTRETETEMLIHMKAQSLSMESVGQLLEKSESRLQEVLTQQQRRFTWLFTLAISLSIIAAVTVTVIALWNFGS